MNRTIAAIEPIPDEEGLVSGRRESWPELLGRLSRQSVAKHFDAYADIPWEDPDYRIDPNDPRWELPEDDPLGSTRWYRSRSPEERARIGLHLVATFMKIGIQFESVLQRGLLELAFHLPNGAPEFRYAYHEIIEEAQHSLMFQEFVNRTGFDVPGLSRLDRALSHLVIGFARTFPELFFFFVLGGEDPIDHVQREALRGTRPIHPLLRRILQIHVTEEARHLCFARQYLRRSVPRLNAAKRFVLSLRVPILLAVMAQRMMRPSAELVRRYRIPRAVLHEAYRDNPRHRERTLAAVAKVRELAEELGLVTPYSGVLWSWLGLRGAPSAPAT